MKPFFRKYRALKVAVLIALLSAAAVLGTGEYLSRHYRTLLLDKLPAITMKATDSLYRLSVGDIRVNVLSRSISFFKIRLRPDSAVLQRMRAEKKLPAMLLDIEVRELEIAGLKTDKGKAITEVKCRSADIYHPRILITLTDISERQKNAPLKAAPVLKQLLANALNIHDPELIFKTGSGEDAGMLSAKGGEIKLQSWSYEPGKKADSARLLHAQEGYVQLCHLTWHRPGLRYNYSADTIAFESAAHRATLSGIKVKPAQPREHLYSVDGFRKEVYEGDIREVVLRGFNWEALLAGKELRIAQADINYPSLAIYLSQLYPPGKESKVGNYPQELLQRLDYLVDIPLVNLYRGSFHYAELSEKTKRDGMLDFSSISGVITGITNAKPLPAGDTGHCFLKFTCHFMRKSNLGAIFDFPLGRSDGAFKITGQLQELSGAQLNETAMALAMAELKSLQMHKMDFAIDGNDSAAEGDFVILYNDLKVKIKKMDQATQQLRNRGFVSFLANGLLLYNDNPMDGGPVRVAHTSIVRDPTKSFFNLIWKSLFNAGVQTAVRQEGITDMVNKHKANRGRHKLHFFRKLFPKRVKKDGQK